MKPSDKDIIEEYHKQVLEAREELREVEELRDITLKIVSDALSTRMLVKGCTNRITEIQQNLRKWNETIIALTKKIENESNDPPYIPHNRMFTNDSIH